MKSMRLYHITQTPSPNTIAIATAAQAALHHYAPETATVIMAQPTDFQADDLRNCDGLLLGTIENIGALAGLTKDLFDRCYNDWLGHCDGLPVGIYIRAGLDGTATSRTLTSYSKALGWRLIAPPLILHGTYDVSMTADAADLAGRLAAGIDAGIF